MEGEFVDTEKDFPFLSDDIDCVEFSKNLHSEIRKLESEGYERVPDDHAPPEDGYEYVAIGFTLYYRKKPIALLTMSENIKIEEYTPVYVETMPEKKESGILYISKKFGLAIHLCACGCGMESVMDFQPEWENGWVLKEEGDLITFSPSILNRFCNAHYFIEKNKIRWA